MCTIKLWALRTPCMLARKVMYRLYCICSNKTVTTCHWVCLLLYSMNKSVVNMFVCRCTVRTCVCLCVWLAEQINRQWAVRWRSPPLQIIDTILAERSTKSSKKPDLTHSSRNEQKRAARNTTLSILIPLFVPSVSFWGLLFVSLQFAFLSVTVWHSLCLCLRAACSEMLRPRAGLKVWLLRFGLQSDYSVLFTVCLTAYV